MAYKGYVARVDFDSEDGVFVGRVTGINDVVGFHGESVVELKAAFEEAVDDYLATCAKLGREPQHPYSGRFNVRLSPDLHARAAAAAARRGVSLNRFVEEAIAGEVESRGKGTRGF
ncbi:type II toxin-antitoxin system HicB family antitoxin [Methyloraptor flagellatus]